MLNKVGKFLIKNFWFLMFLGLFIRLILAGISSWNNDIHVWYSFAADLKNHVGVYTNRTFSYPPGLAIILAIIYFPLTIFSGPDQWGKFSLAVDKLSANSLLFHPIINSPFFGFYTKIPLFLAEIALLYIFYLTYRNTIFTDKLKILALVFYLNPLIIFLNAVHAQLDVFVVLTVVISVYFFRKKSFLFAGLFLGAATTMKLYPGFLFLAYLYIIFFEARNWSGSIKKAILFVLGFIFPVGSMLVYMHFVPAASVSTFARVDTIGFEGSLNLAFINYLPPLVPFISKNSSILVKIMQYCLFTVPFIGLLSAIYINKKLPRLRPYILESVSVIIIFLIFLFSSRTNPNYLVWVMPFLLIVYTVGAISFSNIASISLAALLFYFGVHSLSFKALFFPMTYFGYPVDKICDDYMRMSSLRGSINSKIYADVFLISAIWFIASEFSIIYKISNFSKLNNIEEYEDD